MTFRDPPPPKYFDPAVLEKIVRDAQNNNTQLGLLDREVGKSKAYLNKVGRHSELCLERRRIGLTTASCVLSCRQLKTRRAVAWRSTTWRKWRWKGYGEIGNEPAPIVADNSRPRFGIVSVPFLGRCIDENDV